MEDLWPLCVRKFFSNFIYPHIFTKILGLDLCANTLVGDEMLKGISGGEKKRLSTGNYLGFLLFVVFLGSSTTSLVFPGAANCH